MTRATFVRYLFPITLVLLVTAIVLMSAFLLIVAVPDLSRAAGGPPTESPGVAPTPTPSPTSPMADSPIGVEVGADADCAACHITTNGTVGTRDIPRMAHPLWGWQDCTACHTTGSLVATAPGHSGIHKDQCLVCHRPPDAATASPPPERPEHMGLTQPCTSCHGLDKHAPLPADMVGRNNCWVCHNGPEFNYLFDASPSPTIPPASAAPSGLSGGLGTPLGAAGAG